jgi:DNA-binding transcriptional MerR regulator
VSSYTIGEVAERSGFTASALRYYEGIGLVQPAARTDAGYRLYDDQTLARLAFVAGAKKLGCSLEEIADLVAIWDGERCGPVQRRYHELVTGRIRTTQAQIAELVALAAELQVAAARLAGEPVDGPCGDDCACLTVTADPPVACTLDAGAIPDRMAAWRAMVERARSRSRTADGAMRLEFGDHVPVDELARLAAAEHGCCAFLSFAVTVDSRGVGLEVRAPADARDVVTAMFGDPVPLPV